MRKIKNKTKQKREDNVCATDLAREYERTTSTINYKKYKIKNVVTVMDKM